MAKPRPKPTQVSESGIMSFESTSAITIRVGKTPNVKNFIAHESFLTSRSEFFRRAMNGNWTEAKTRTINLPDDHAEVFAHYINYVYTCQLPTTSKTGLDLEKLTDEELSQHVNNLYRTIFDVFVLSEKLQDTTTKNAMMEAALATSIGDKTGWHTPSIKTVNKIYNGTPVGSPARRFVAELWTSLSIVYTFSVFHKLHEKFAKDLGESLENDRNPVGSISAQKGIVAYQEETEGG